ncbi:MAG TPA: TolC family protein, partial [Opitutaceae bacterium]
MKTLLLSLLTATATLAVTPEVATPTAFRDADAIAWKTGEPNDRLTRGEWWKLFADPVLDDLIVKALAQNQDLRAAAARVEQARAAAGIARADYWPQLAFGASMTREQTSESTTNVQPHTLGTTYRAPLVASWELDLFGR